jgi:thymidylate kinase
VRQSCAVSQRLIPSLQMQQQEPSFIALRTFEPPEHLDAFRVLVQQGEEELRVAARATAAVATVAKAVVVEGLDGVGKTTASKQLAARLNAVWLKTPPEEMAAWRPHYDAQPEEVRRCFYQLGNVIVSRRLRLASARESFVLDRFWPSTYAYSAAHLAVSPTSGATVVGSWPQFLVQPNLIVLLTLPEEERLQRLSTRHDGAALGEERLLQRDPAYRQRVLECYRRIPHLVEVDASGSVQEVCDRLLLAERRMGT